MAQRIVVTGGGGFLGKALCKRLLHGGYEVISVARGDYPDLAAAGVRTLRADLSDDPAALVPLIRGADVMFHTAAHVKMWGPYEDFWRGNVVATRNVMRICRQAGIGGLVFTSSPSVIADGRNLEGVNESYPYPRRYSAYYPQTKAQAEREVLAANGVEGLSTVALRPHLIFGPGDTNLVPMIVDRARKGRLVRIGSGDNLVDLSFIEDCVEAHILAWRALGDKPRCRGRAYFISQRDPVLLWGWIDEVLRRNGLAPVSRSLPKSLALPLASLCELAARFHFGPREPLLTRFLVSEMATHHYFDLSAAMFDLGYKPRYSIEAALELTFPRK